MKDSSSATACQERGRQRCMDTWRGNIHAGELTLSHTPHPNGKERETYLGTLIKLNGLWQLFGGGKGRGEA